MIFVDKAWTLSGLAVMALKTGTEVLVGIDCRVDEYRHKTIIKGFVIVESSGNFDKDVENLTQKSTLVLE